jgi:hypothetical protein
MSAASEACQQLVRSISSNAGVQSKREELNELATNTLSEFFSHPAPLKKGWVMLSHTHTHTHTHQRALSKHAEMRLRYGEDYNEREGEGEGGG